MKKLLTILLTLAMLATLLAVPGAALAEEKLIKTFQATPTPVNHGSKVVFTVFTTVDAQFIALYDGAGNQLTTWAADEYAALANDRYTWSVLYPLNDPGEQRFTFGASLDGENYEVNGSFITIPVTEETSAITASGAADATNVKVTSSSEIAPYTNVGFTVTTTDNAKFLQMVDANGEVVAEWTAEDCTAFNNNGKLMWVVMVQPGPGDFQKFTFKASEDGTNYGKETITFLNIAAVDMSNHPEYLGDWYGIMAGARVAMTLNADGTSQLTIGDKTKDIEWHEERGQVLIASTPTSVQEDGSLHLAVEGDEIAFSREDPFALVEMPYDPLPVEDFWYDEEYARLDAYQGYELNLILPREIDGVQLTMIGGGMMNRASHGDNYDIELPVRSVVIPETYTEIPYWAFSYCETLETVICYAPIETLQDGLFTGCTSLREVVFVNGVKNIGNRVFDGCTNLETVYLGGSVQSINDYAFEGSNFTAEQCLTSVADRPDVDAMLAAVKSAPMPKPEPTSAPVAVAIGEEGAAFFGTWSAETMDMGGDVYNVADMGMVMDVTLNADGTCSMFDGEETDESVWTLADGIAMLDGMNLTVAEDGRLCMEEEGIKMFFAKAEGGAQPEAEPTDDPGALEGYKPGYYYSGFMGTWYGISMMDGEDVYNLADMGLDVTIELRDDGTATLDMAGDADDGAWEGSDDGQTIVLEGMELTLQDDGTLKMEQDGMEMLFGREPVQASEPSGEDLEAYADYLGLWYCQTLADGEMTVNLADWGMEMTLELGEDGTAILVTDGESESMRWNGAEGGVLVGTILISMQEDDTLTASEDGTTMIFGRTQPVGAPTEEPEPEPTEEPIPEPTEEPTPEPTEEPGDLGLDEDLQRYVGTWHACYTHTGGMQGDQRELYGLQITMVLREDGTGTIDFPELEEHLWYPGEEYLQYGTVYFGDGADAVDMPLTLLDDGFMRYGTELGGYIIFSQDVNAVWAAAVESSAEPQPEPTAVPTESNEPISIDGRMEVWYSCTSAEMQGMTVDASLLGGDYALLFHENGFVEMTLAGMEVPGALKWSQRTVDTSNGPAEALIIDYYGQELTVFCTEAGFDLNYFDTMLMHFEPSVG